MLRAGRISKINTVAYRTFSFSRYLQILFEAGALGNCNTAGLKFTLKLHLYKVAIKIDAIIGLVTLSKKPSSRGTHERIENLCFYMFKYFMSIAVSNVFIHQLVSIKKKQYLFERMNTKIM